MRAIAEIDLIHVQLEDAVLRIPRLDRARDRGAVSEGPHPRAVHESDLSRQWRAWCRNGGAALLREIGEGAESRRGGDARRATERARALQSTKIPRSRRPAPQHHHRG